MVILFGDQTCPGANKLETPDLVLLVAPFKRVRFIVVGKYIGVAVAVQSRGDLTKQILARFDIVDLADRDRLDKLIVAGIRLQVLQ